MKYYVVKALVPTVGAETDTVTAYDTLSEAKVQYHTALSNAINQATTQKIMCTIIDSDGKTYQTEGWTGV